MRSATNLRGWLLTITRNCAMDAHRSARRTVAVEDPATLLAARSPLPGSTRAPSSGQRWPGCRSGNGQRSRSKYVSDLDHREIARVLDTTPR